MGLTDVAQMSNVLQMSNFTPLYGSILTSTIWTEDSNTRLVWITMLAMADASGYVGASVPGLANLARVPLEDCRKALEKFQSPDPDSRTKDREGRRIEPANGGWKLINYEAHRERATEIRHNIMSALRMREMRAKRKKLPGVANVPEQSKQAQHVPNVPDCSTDRGKAETSACADASILSEERMEEITYIIGALKLEGITGKHIKAYCKSPRITSALVESLIDRMRSEKSMENYRAAIVAVLRDVADGGSWPPPSPVQPAPFMRIDGT